MSDQSDRSSPVLLTLRQFKPTQKPKLSHFTPNYASSSDDSPVARRRDLIINVDSDSDTSDIAICSNASNETENKPKTNGETIAENHSDASTSTPARTSEKEFSRFSKRKKSDLKRSNTKRMKFSDDSDDEVELNEKIFLREEYSDSDDDIDNIKSDNRKQLLDLLNNDDQNSLSTIPNMTQKKMNLIISNRPYSSWQDLVSKFDYVKGLNRSTLEVINNTVISKNIVQDLMKKCEELASKIERKVSSANTLISKQPALLNPEMKLSGYQLLGLNWLALMRSRSLNSILADEMGLGKTIQVIAFLAYLKEQEFSIPGYPHLVVVPSSTLDNWYNEFQKWCPSFHVEIYHGNQSERQTMRHDWNKDGFGDIDVILTTYTCSSVSRADLKLFKKKEFNYIIFDEAHMLKNVNTRRYESLNQFNGNFKILLTGTPLQNNLLELMSLLVFLMPTLFQSKLHCIKLLFSKCTKTVDEFSSAYEKERLKEAKRIIEPFMLRRLKENVLHDLPTKTITVEKCSLTDDQRVKYDEILEEFKENIASKETTAYLTYFTMLRKMANHPLLLRYHFTEDKLEKMAERLARDTSFKGTNPQYIKEDLYFKSDYELFCLCQDHKSLHDLQYYIQPEILSKSGKFEKLSPLLKSLKETGHRVLIFSQFITMLDILEEYCELNDFNYLRLDGSTQTVDRQELINNFNEDDNIFIFLLSTKAGGLGINLTAADTVIIHDIDFNPYNDKQAEDRSHRVGQTKPVKVYKLIGENTVEEGIFKTATSKLYLEKEVTACQADENSESKTIIQLLKESLKSIES